DETRRLEAAPVPEPDEDEVADACGNESREKDGEQHGAHPDAALDEQHARDERSAEEGRDGGETARAREHPRLPLARRREACCGDADDGAERDHRSLRPEYGAEG